MEHVRVTASLHISSPPGCGFPADHDGGDTHEDAVLLVREVEEEEEDAGLSCVLGPASCWDLKLTFTSEPPRASEKERF